MNLALRRSGFLLIALGLALLALTGIRLGEAAPHADASVSMIDFDFSPGNVTVAVGESVTWINDGQAPHTATANDGSFDTGILNGGESASATMSSPGSFSYYCAIHPEMQGTVTVSGSADPDDTPEATPDSLPKGGDDPVSGAPVPLLAALGVLLVGGGIFAAVRSRAA